MIRSLLAVLLGTTSVLGIIFDANVKPLVTRCFSEDVAANIVFVVEAHSKTQPLEIEVKSTKKQRCSRLLFYWKMERKEQRKRISTILQQNP